MAHHAPRGELSLRSSPVTRNESLMGFLLEPVHSSTPPLVSGTVRSRALAAKVNWRLLSLFRRPATAPRRFYAPGLGCSRGHGAAHDAEGVTTRRASSPPSGCLHALGSSAFRLLRTLPVLAAPWTEQRREDWARHPHPSLATTGQARLLACGRAERTRASGASRGRASSRPPS